MKASVQRLIRESPNLFQPDRSWPRRTARATIARAVRDFSTFGDQRVGQLLSNALPRAPHFDDIPPLGAEPHHDGGNCLDCKIGHALFWIQDEDLLVALHRSAQPQGGARPQGKGGSRGRRRGRPPRMAVSAHALRPGLWAASGAPYSGLTGWGASKRAAIADLRRFVDDLLSALTDPWIAPRARPRRRRG